MSPPNVFQFAYDLAARYLRVGSPEFSKLIALVVRLWLLGRSGTFIIRSLESLHHANFTRELVELYDRTIRPRCGCPDAGYGPGEWSDSPLVREYRRFREVRREMLALWKKRGISWNLHRPVPRIGVQEQYEEIERSLNLWGKQSFGFRFEHRPGDLQADLQITCGRGTRWQMDGAGGTLAWCELPPGDDRQLLLVFDADEKWTLEEWPETPDGSIWYVPVLRHELGHFFGLDHLDPRKQGKALMNPYYDPRVDIPLPPDITAFRKLYGEPKGGTGPDGTEGTGGTGTGGTEGTEGTGDVVNITPPILFSVAGDRLTLNGVSYRLIRDGDHA